MTFQRCFHVDLSVPRGRSPEPFAGGRHRPKRLLLSGLRSFQAVNRGRESGGTANAMRDHRTAEVSVIRLGSHRFREPAQVDVPGQSRASRPVGAIPWWRRKQRTSAGRYERAAASIADQRSWGPWPGFGIAGEGAIVPASANSPRRSRGREYMASLPSPARGHKSFGRSQYNSTPLSSGSRR